MSRLYRYMPNIGCSELTVNIGTWCYLIGSVFFTVSRSPSRSNNHDLSLQVAGILPVIRRSYANVKVDTPEPTSEKVP